MKNLEQIQEENRKAIIMANNPEAKSYEEALKREEESYIANTVFKYGGFVYREYIPPEGIYQKIGKPLTLDRVLIATQHKFFSSIMSEKESVLHVEYNLGIDDPFWIEWDLTKPTLEQQTEETQRNINKLLVSENDK